MKSTDLTEPNKCSPAEIERVAVASLSGIGIAVLHTPFLQQLRRLCPHAKITLLVRFSAVEELLAAAGLVDEFIVMHGSWWHLLRTVRRRRFDLFINTYPVNRAAKNILARLSGAPYRWGFAEPGRPWAQLAWLNTANLAVAAGLHDAAQNLRLLQLLGAAPPPPAPVPAVCAAAGSAAAAQRFLADAGLVGHKPLIALHPGSSTEFGMAAKRWPVARFAALANQLAASHQAAFVIMGGPAERELQERLAAAIMAPAVVVAVPLGVTAELLRRCALCISNDTGLMHIAAAVGTKTVGIFGPSDPVRTRPLHAASVVVRAGSDCSPCWSHVNPGGRISCQTTPPTCLERVTSEEVYRAAVALLAAAGPCGS